MINAVLRTSSITRYVRLAEAAVAEEDKASVQFAPPEITNDARNIIELLVSLHGMQPHVEDWYFAYNEAILDCHVGPVKRRVPRKPGHDVTLLTKSSSYQL